MLPYLCLGFDKLMPRRKKVGMATARSSVLDLKNAQPEVTGKRMPTMGRNKTGRPPLRCERRDNSRSIEIQERKRDMASKVTHISGLIHRVASSCLTHHPAAGLSTDDDDDDLHRHDPDHHLRIWEEQEQEEQEKETNTNTNNYVGGVLERVREMETVMSETFDAVSAVKRAYVSLQDAHSPWDPDKMRAADAAVVAELKRLGRVRDRYRRCVVSGGGGGDGHSTVATPLSEAVAPYEAALDELRREIKAREAEVEGLKEKLRSSCSTTTTPRSGKKRYGGSKRVSCITAGLAAAAAPAGPTPELFEACMEQVKSASKSFTSQLLSLMRAARWDITAAIHSIIEGDGGGTITVTPEPSHALESYINRRVFQGFENETFYIEGSLTSLLHPAEFRRDCFTQFRDMRGMEPAELLGILPTCQFGCFAAKKYLAVMHPKMEESLFGSTEQRRQVVVGAHPRTEFYGEFLRLAKAVWLLHLLAFALDPAPSHFEASKGAEFNADYMESVARGRGAGTGTVVGFSVSPGFKLGNGSVVPARVYLVPRAKEL